MDLLLPVFQLLYFVAHFLVSLCQAVHEALHDLYRAAWELTTWLLQAPGKGPLVPRKAPHHPVLLLLPGQYKSSQLQHVVKVLVALARGGASCLSVYEAAGKLRDQQWALRDLLQAALPAFNVHLIPDETADDSSIQQQQFTQESHAGDVLLLRVVSLESGGRALLGSVRQLARAAGPDRVVEVTCEALHSFLATPQCSSCWGGGDAKCHHNSGARDPPLQRGGDETCSQDALQLNDSDERAARKRCVQQTNRDSAIEESLQTGVQQTNRDSATEDSLQTANCVLVKNSISSTMRASIGNTGGCLEESSKWRVGKGVDASCGEAERRWCRFGGSLLPDPDLVLVVGEYLSSNGFPPWFLRLSEFVSTPRLHKIDQTELTRILQNYSKTEQRYGR